MVNFLNVKKDIPIVAHKVKFDRDQVLRKAFMKLGIENMMPKKERWRCTLDMCDRVPDIFTRSLDECCKYFGLKGRDIEKTHNAVEDC